MMTRTSEPAGWIRLTLHTSGKPLYLRADVIEAVHAVVNAAQVVYSLVDTGRDQWAVREPAEEVMTQICRVLA